jgi:hypothetical protein
MKINLQDAIESFAQAATKCIAYCKRAMVDVAPENTGVGMAKAKHWFRFLLAGANVVASVYLLGSALTNINGDYEFVRTWFPIRPIPMTILIATIVVTSLYLYYYLYKNKHQLGSLKITGVVILVFWLQVIFALCVLFYITITS